MRNDGLDRPAASFVAFAVVLVIAFGAFIFMQREAAISKHESAVAHAEAVASASAEAARIAAERAARLASQPSPTPYPSAPPGTYRVQKGDSLFSVASSLGVSPKLLVHWNIEEYPRLASSPALKPGTLLAIEGPPLTAAGEIGRAHV